MKTCPHCGKPLPLSNNPIKRGVQVLPDLVKGAFKKPKFPKDCKRNCDIKECQKSETP